MDLNISRQTQWWHLSLPDARALRQVVGKTTDGDFFVFSFTGGAEWSEGVTLDEALDIIEKELKESNKILSYALNIDGGSSLCTGIVVGKKLHAFHVVGQGYKQGMGVSRPVNSLGIIKFKINQHVASSSLGSDFPDRVELSLARNIIYKRLSNSAISGKSTAQGSSPMKHGASSPARRTSPVTGNRTQCSMLNTQYETTPINRISSPLEVFQGEILEGLRFIYQGRAPPTTQSYKVTTSPLLRQCFGRQAVTSEKAGVFNLSSSPSHDLSGRKLIVFSAHYLTPSGQATHV